ncbi:hypothetical protein PRIPAC_87927 [Pristionchus pacificus]|uniref:Uncharacterized protein n=1 Tax=Pristionchus pacificus TaxID=54126 RepID=A0A2A6B8V3_PRIPA|nr:hypothetical protein PRIPAC_87927 [Pristionchus pacificus]|eukprot:PDM62294.1 hypothetical protein PRIPAC_51736 [Pristionchus pacificus]
MPFTEAVVCCCHGARCELAQNDGYEVVPGSMFCPDQKVSRGKEKSRKEKIRRGCDPKASRREDKKDASYESVLSYSEPVEKKKERKKRKYTMKNQNDIGCAEDLYLGAMAAYKAERETRKRSTFKLYHKFPRSNTLDGFEYSFDDLHFPILTRCRYDGKTLYYVEMKNSEEASMQFDSIEKLVSYYQAYPLIELKPNGETNWLTYVFEGLYTILDILILFAIVKRNKTILNIGFWITMIFFIYYSIECVIFIPLSYITMDDLNWALKEYGPKGRQGKELLWWFHGFIYLCAINEARRECTELKQMSADNEMEKKPIV